MQAEEATVREAVRPILELRKSLLPKLDTLIKEQKRIKDAQKSAMEKVTKKMMDHGGELNRLIQKEADRRAELASLSGKIALTGKDEERLGKAVEKARESLQRCLGEAAKVKERLAAVFCEWADVAAQAKRVIEGCEAERRASLAALVGEYHTALHQSHTAHLAGPGSTRGLARPASQPLPRSQSRSVYAASLSSLNQLAADHKAPLARPPSYDTACTAADTVSALYAYAGQAADELSFAAGDRIRVLGRDEDPWWRGLNLATQATGLFPSNFVKHN